MAYKHYRRSEIPYNKNKNYVPTHKLEDSHRNRMKTWKQFICIFYPMILNSPSVPPYFELLSKSIMDNILIYMYYVMYTYIIRISWCGLYRVFRSKRDNKFPFHNFLSSLPSAVSSCVLVMQYCPWTGRFTSMHSLYTPIWCVIKASMSFRYRLQKSCTKKKIEFLLYLYG